jgi:MinD-like ATPase involved in chromosome partitioning or flagellar assembly
MTEARIYVFCSNRGGIGKSSLAAQLAPAVALANPERDVILLDLSIQGDASTFLLGGVAEPKGDATGARTRGGEVMAAQPPQKTAAAFLEAVLKPAPAQPRAPASSFWRGTSAPAAAAAPALDWREHAVQPSEVHPGGSCPPNLHVIPGGHALYGVPFPALAPALRRALQSTGALVLVDTDAELSERGASLAGIAAADELAMVVSTSWCDYLRTLDDPANSLLSALGFLSQVHPELKPRIGHVIFNNVQKRLSAPGGLAMVPGLLAFTPPSAALDALAEISLHLRSVACEPSAGRSAFFVNPVALASNSDFLRTYVTAVPTVAETVWQSAAQRGQPLVCSADTSDTVQQAAGHLRAVAARF